MKLLLILIILFQEQPLKKLKVVITGIEELKGDIRIALVNSEETFLSENPLRTNVIPTKSNTLIVSFKNLVHGSYAVQVFHDLNSDGELDKNFFGVPTEPYVFSNQAKGTFGPPDFEDARFELINDKTIYLKFDTDE